MEDGLLEKKKKEAADTAQDLCYGSDVVAKIYEAKTEGEIYRILASARRGEYKKPKS